MLSNPEYEELLKRARCYLSNIQQGYSQQSVIYYGLRGVGKTDLLNSIEIAADNMEILYRHILAAKNKRFSAQLITAIHDFRLDIGVEKDEIQHTGILSEDLTEAFVVLGKAALKTNDTICLLIDNIQYLSPEEINGLTVSIHRCNQIRLPIMALCAGLPKILKTVGDACPYSERLFRFEVVGVLN